jgi:hypothetical protein
VFKVIGTFVFAQALVMNGKAMNRGLCLRLSRLCVKHVKELVVGIDIHPVSVGIDIGEDNMGNGDREHRLHALGQVCPGRVLVLEDGPSRHVVER